MRPSRLALLAALGAILLLAACGGSHHSSTSTTTTGAPATTTPATNSTPTTTTTTTTSQPAPSSTTPPTTVPSGPAPQVVSLTGPHSPVECNAPTSIDLEWVSKNATDVSLRIDDGTVFAHYSNGAHTELVPFACDGTAQTYQLTAHGTGGRTATKSLTLAEREST